MSNKQYVTISELARQAGVTRQTVYNRLSKGELSNYTKEIDSKKLINIKALELFTVKESVKQDVKLDAKESVKKVSNYTSNSEVDRTQEYIDCLKQQIEVKDKLITELNAELTQALNLISQGHYLLAADSTPAPEQNNPNTNNWERVVEQPPKRRHWWQK